MGSSARGCFLVVGSSVQSSICSTDLPVISTSTVDFLIQPRRETFTVSVFCVLFAISSFCLRIGGLAKHQFSFSRMVALGRKTASIRIQQTELIPFIPQACQTGHDHHPGRSLYKQKYLRPYGSYAPSSAQTRTPLQGCALQATLHSEKQTAAAAAPTVAALIQVPC